MVCLKMMTQNTLEKTNHGLFADVDQVLTVLENDQLKVDLQIKAQNLTQQTILLDENYFIPVTHASSIEARDVKKKKALRAFHDGKKNRLEVVFRPGTLLRPNEEFTWYVSFVTRFGIMEPNESNVLTGIFALEPRQSYKRIPITNHRIKLLVKFQRPRTGELYRKVKVSQSNTLKVGVRFIEKNDRIEAKFDPFDLAKGNKIKFAFNYHYEPSATEICPGPDDGPHSGPDAGPEDFQQRLWRYAKTACSSIWRIVRDVLMNQLKDLAEEVIRKILGK